MKFLKNFISFCIPLITMLFALTIFTIVSQAVDTYKEKIRSDYSIVIITKTPLANDNINQLGGISVEKIVPMDRAKILASFKNRLTQNSLNFLDQRLPYFYQVYLQEFPSTYQLEQIIEELKGKPSIYQIETFSKNHNQIYSLLTLSQKIVFILYIIILLFAIFIISKQVKIWFYEHKERIAIMKLHGASMLYSAKPIILLTFFSSIFSTIIVVIFIVLFSENSSLIFSDEIKDITTINLNIVYESIKLLFVSLFISFISIFGVLTKLKIKPN
ncbi:FtsX-like permease family protein [Arcobacter sp. FWKO B]|uniref:FtsX-like permease family protein n=1 Tax=Arcobacter sp. FWKO B TaxID=2593672 RepID=UPI0018A3B913|nr:FtsX-like permease family protein [Arcobacter sp. FWKO B]QOG11168.1 cell division protein FtsX [Arcobacter sp. FWKO B]